MYGKWPSPVPSSRNFRINQPRYWCPELKADDPAKKGVCSNYLCDSKPGEDIKLTGPTGKAMLLPEKDASTRDRNESKSGLASPIFFCQTWQNSQSIVFFLVKLTELQQLSGIPQNSEKIC